jgi:hypothetical protein
LDYTIQEQDPSLTIKPNSFISFSLRNYDNFFYFYQIQAISFGVIFAALLVWLRYTYFNKNHTMFSFANKLLSLIKPKLTPLRGLFCLWSLCSYKCFFDLDMLKYAQHLSGVESLNKEKRETINFEVPGLIKAQILDPWFYHTLPSIA